MVINSNYSISCLYEAVVGCSCRAPTHSAGAACHSMPIAKGSLCYTIDCVLSLSRAIQTPCRFGYKINLRRKKKIIIIILDNYCSIGNYIKRCSAAPSRRSPSRHYIQKKGSIGVYIVH